MVVVDSSTTFKEALEKDLKEFEYKDIVHLLAVLSIQFSAVRILMETNIFKHLLFVFM